MNRRTILKSSILALFPVLSNNNEINFHQFYSFSPTKAFEISQMDHTKKCKHTCKPFIDNEIHADLIFYTAECGPEGSYDNPQYHDYIIYYGAFPDRLWNPLTKFYKLSDNQFEKIKKGHNWPRNKFDGEFAIGLNDVHENLWSSCCMLLSIDNDKVLLYRS